MTSPLLARTVSRSRARRVAAIEAVIGGEPLGFSSPTVAQSLMVLVKGEFGSTKSW